MLSPNHTPSVRRDRDGQAMLALLQDEPLTLRGVGLAERAAVGEFAAGTLGERATWSVRGEQRKTRFDFVRIAAGRSRNGADETLHVGGGGAFCNHAKALENAPAA